jgi:hypothetical protein
LQIIDDVLSSGTRFNVFGLTDDSTIRAAAGIVAAVLLTLLLPATFILLPASRRKAKVRWPHVNRIVVYSLFALTTLLLVMLIAGIIRLLTDSDLALAIARLAPMLFWIALPVWWAVAIKRYLKMEHSAAIAGVMTFMLALLLSPLLLHVFPQWIMRMILN